MLEYEREEGLQSCLIEKTSTEEDEKGSKEGW